MDFIYYLIRDSFGSHFPMIGINVMAIEGPVTGHFLIVANNIGYKFGMRYSLKKSLVVVTTMYYT